MQPRRINEPRLDRKRPSPEPSQPKTLPRQTRADFCRKWGFSVTLCIAAKTANGPIATVSDRRITVWDTVWRLCEAKFAAEMASGSHIGKETTVLILREDSKFDMISPSSLRKIREVWEKERSAGVSEDASYAVRMGLQSLVRKIEESDPKVVDIPNGED